MGLSLKKEEMVQFLEAAKTPGEAFSCMLWGTVYADISHFQGHSELSRMVGGFGGAGVAGSLNNAFCYIGLTGQGLYVIALDAYNTSSITATLAVPIANITAIKITKGLGSYLLDIACGEPVSLTVKGTSIGTNIKDQKERMAAFIAAMEGLKARFIQ